MKYITNMQDLCDFLSADEPARMNRRLYKDTGCGASISVRVTGHGWIHNGASAWEQLTVESPLEAFTIQTIVEGSDATVDSDIFKLPVATKDIDEWIEYMEEESTRLWQQANTFLFLVTKEGYTEAYLRSGWGIEWEGDFPHWIPAKTRKRIIEHANDIESDWDFDPEEDVVDGWTVKKLDESF